MKSALPIFLVAALSGCTTLNMPPTASCQNLSDCVSQDGIAVIGESQSTRQLLNIAREGATNFKQRFGVDATPVAIVQGGHVSADLNHQIEAAGFSQTLPWLSESDKASLQAAAVESQVLEQTKNLPKEQQAAILKQALMQFKSQKSSETNSIDGKQAGALTHELGHLWFIAAFKPDRDSSDENGHGYGGWAPDWLDETAAILMENDELTASRRDAFSSISASELYPLIQYLSMDHPLSAAAKEAIKEFDGSALNKGESRSLVLSGAEAEAFLKKSQAGNPGTFYTQTRGFIDFIHANTRETHVFSNIARHLAAGGSFESFLSTQNDLPTSMESLSHEWQAWLDKR